MDDDALRGATLAAYFPDGLKFSQLLDSAYFRKKKVNKVYPLHPIQIQI